MAKIMGGTHPTDPLNAPAVTTTEERGSRAQELLRLFVEAFAAGAIQITSEKIAGEPGTGFDDPNGPSPGYPPHPWHEEWLSHAREAIKAWRIES